MAKIRFTITGEYEAHPENYAGETDIPAMIAIDEETLLIVDAIELDDNMTLKLEPVE